MVEKLTEDRLNALRESLSRVDAADDACPIRAGRAAERCPKCGATERQNCGPEVTALTALAEEVRAALQHSSAQSKPCTDVSSTPHEALRSDGGFTPGPWRSSTFQVYAASGDRVAHTGVGQLPPRRSQEAVNNARLIAAAPELLAALKELLADSYPVGSGEDTEVREQALVAIASAEGREP